MGHHARLSPAWACGLALTALACREAGPGPASARSSLVHLTDRLEEAAVESSGPPAAARDERHWSFTGPRPEWKTVSSEQHAMLAGVGREQLSDGIRLKMSAAEQQLGVLQIGGIETVLGELRFEDWDTVLVEARCSDRFAGVTLAYNRGGDETLPTPGRFFMSPDEAPPIFNDGSVQSYAIPLRPRHGAEAPVTLRSLAVLFGALGPAEVDVLSITLVPRGAAFLEDAGVRQVPRQGTTRRTLFAHAPASLAFPIELATGARLDFGLTVIPGQTVTYRIRTGRGGETRILFEESIDDSGAWQQRSVDLSGQPAGSLELVLEAKSEQEGAVALWGAPILSDPRPSHRPNVIFYVIDGGDADLMSLYEYERPTTPFLEELAREGVLFTRAYSSSTWTQPSTVSFMTSLHHSVLGGLKRGIHSTGVPVGAVTLAEHFRRAGYLTASFTANPNAGRIIGLDRGMDLMRDVETEHHSTSSTELHDRFFELRTDYPGTPYWVHFQTTDVHEPNEPSEPFAGRFAAPDARSKLEGWGQRIWQTAGEAFGTTSIAGFYDLALERTGIDRQAYFGTHRDLYDETMAHQDHALEQLVERLKAEGEWTNTLLVIGADHGHPAGTFTRFGRGLVEPQPEPWQGALFDAYATRVPLLVVWSGHIEGGRRFDQPVSMIDVLPTLLDLVHLPSPEILQGQSLAPLLRGEDLEPRPVILDEFRVDESTGAMVGNIEIIDGRWGASLEIGPLVGGVEPAVGRHAVPAGGRWGAVHPFFPEVPRLLLYDLDQDPLALRAVNDEHPELVERYTSLLRRQWQAHRALAQGFGDSEAAPLSPEQLRQLRALGYIR